MFIIDENIPPYIGECIKGLGYSIIEIYQKEYKGMSDDEIFNLAIKEERVIITFDRHFSNIFKYPLNLHFGIIVIKIEPPVIEDIIESLKKLLKKVDKLEYFKNSLIILSKEGYIIKR